VPDGCLLDFDGELLDHLVATGEAELEPSWPCFHTRLYRWRVDDLEFGVIATALAATLKYAEGEDYESP
jgi:uridine phosphorylase